MNSQKTHPRAAGQAAHTPIRPQYLPILLDMFRDQPLLIATGLDDQCLRGHKVSVIESDDYCRIYKREEVFREAVRACNSHAALVAALEAVLDPRNSHFYRPGGYNAGEARVSAKVIKQARAALAAAKEGAQ